MYFFLRGKNIIFPIVFYDERYHILKSIEHVTQYLWFSIRSVVVSIKSVM